VIKKDDPLKLWEQDGDMERMREFFGKITDGGKKDQIKQLVLAKLAEEQNQKTKANYEEGSADKPNPSERRKGLVPKFKTAWKNSWERWHWKMALPAVALILLIVIGQTGILGQSGLIILPQTKSASPAGMAANTEPATAAMDGYAANDVSRESFSQPQVKGAPAMSKELSMADAPPIAPPIPGPEPEAPPADSSLPRKITHDLNATLQVDDIESAVDQLNSMAKRLGGYVVDSQMDNQQNNAYANMTIKIPAVQFDGARNGLKEIGKVLNQHLTANDITNQYYDADTRLRNWQAEEQRYLEILKQANTVNDIILVENSLSNIRMQIEQLKGQLKLWDHEVAFSTIQVQLQTKPSPVNVDEPWQPISWHETWEASQNAVLKTISTIWNFFNYLVVGLGYALPLILIGGTGYLIYRQWLKKH